MHRVNNFKIKLRVFEKGLLQKISGPRRKEVLTAGKWRKLYNKELHDLYSSPNFMWVLNQGVRWVRHVTYGEKQYVQCCNGKPARKRPFSRHL
jgi:hypothetical protein